nr:hypothetical protein [Tanacetum cinerariifolium]
MATFEVLDELIEITGSIELHKRMRFWFVQEIAEEEGVVVDSLESLKQTHARETAKLAALTDAIAESLAGIHEKECHTNDNESTSEKLVSEDIMNDEGNTETVEDGVDSLVNGDRENSDKVMVQGSNPEEWFRGVMQSNGSGEDKENKFHVHGFLI